MNSRQSEPRVATRILNSRIRHLDLEEDIALHRCDWSAARNISLQRAPLKELRQWSAAPGRRRA